MGTPHTIFLEPYFGFCLCSLPLSQFLKIHLWTCQRVFVDEDRVAIYCQNITVDYKREGIYAEMRLQLPVHRKTGHDATGRDAVAVRVAGVADGR